MLSYQRKPQKYSHANTQEYCDKSKYLASFALFNLPSYGYIFKSHSMVLLLFCHFTANYRQCFFHHFFLAFRHRIKNYLIGAIYAISNRLFGLYNSFLDISLITLKIIRTQHGINVLANSTKIRFNSCFVGLCSRIRAIKSIIRCKDAQYTSYA